jgi:ElaB/YqjD/DUF883 family membrane-anchored ribosome-binding protein
MTTEENVTLQDMAHTRSRIEQDMHELRYRFSPEGLIDQTQDKLKDVTEVVMDAIQGNSQVLSEKAQEFGRNVVETVTDNPWPTTLVGLGVGLVIAGSIMVGRNSENTSAIAEQYGSDGFAPSNGRLADFGETVSETVTETGTQVKRQARRTQSRLERWLNNEPLLFGATAVVAGAALGLLLPSSEIEDELMGQRRDELLRQTKAKVDDVRSAAGEAAKEIGATLKSEVSKQSEQVIHAIEDAVVKTAHNTESTVKESADKVKDAITK